MNNSKKVCMISSLHGLYDDRIYWKEALSLKNHGYDVIHIGVGDEDKDFISEHGIRLIQIRKILFFSDPLLDKLFRFLTIKKSIYKSILKVALELDCHVYHFHDLQINKIAPRLKKRSNKIVIYDVHEDYYQQILSYIPKHPIKKIFYLIYALFIKYWEKRCVKKYDFIISAYPRMIENFKKTLHINSCILYNYTNIEPEKPIPYENKIYDVIYTGLISDSRGGLEILKSAIICKKEIPDVQFLLLGPFQNKEFEKILNDFIANNSLERNVLLLSPIRYDEVKRYYHKSRIGLGIFKPIPIFKFAIQIKTFEYMVYGLPIVCSNFGNIHKFVTESNSGISVNPNHPEEIAEAIIKLLTDRKLYNTLSENGRFAAKNKYNWRIEEEKLLKIYDSLLNNEQ